MRPHRKAAVLLTMLAALTVAGCSGDDEPEPSASNPDSAAGEEVDVAAVVADVRDATACEAWSGGKVAGEGVVAGWAYVCDEDGDLVPETTLNVYATESALDTDLATLETASGADYAILRGDHYTVVSNNPDHVAAVTDLGAEVVRESEG